MNRLHPDLLDTLPASVARPEYDWKSSKIGMVHIGVGAFHKGHQAVYTDSAMAKSGGNWAIAGISMRSDKAANTLGPQDCLFSVASREGDSQDFRIIGALRSIITLAHDREAATKLLVHPDVHVITMTITEKGYCLNPDTGELDINHADIAHDLEHPFSPVSAIGFLCSGLARRMELKRGGLSLISCDNLLDNGSKLRAGVLGYLKLVDPVLMGWVAKNCTFPATMVDRIIPSTTEDDILAASKHLGLRDEALVMTEPFSQWVIEDKFAGPVPDWASAGAQIVRNVHAYELAKLRMLNGPHSAIAYLGALSGAETVHEVMGDKLLGGFIDYLMREEIAPVLDPPGDFDLNRYIDDLQRRFRNSALNHRCLQIAMDGSQKLPQRILPVIVARLQQQLCVDGLTAVVAAWIGHASGRGYSGQAPILEDPLAMPLREIGAQNSDIADLVDAMLQLEQIFSPELIQHMAWRKRLTELLDILLNSGASALVSNILADKQSR